MAVAVWLKVSQGGSEAELPALYLIAVLAILMAGPGGYSLDARRRGFR
jgi:uncharacterized membrane protein YphA (DoxX/SURF4 family)